MKQIRYSIFIFSFFLFFLPAEAQNDQNVLEEVGRKLEQKGRELLRTIDHYSQALLYDPYNHGYYQSRGEAYFEKGEYRKAIVDYTKGIEYYNGHQKGRLAKMHYRRGLCFYIIGDYDKAVDDFSSAITYRPDVTDAYYFRGKIKHMVYGQPYLARPDFEKVIDDGTDPSVQVVFSRFFLGQYEKAERGARKLLYSVNKFDRKSYALMQYNMAALQALSGNNEEAVRHLRTALDYGYSEYEWLKRDINFTSLAQDRNFQEVLAYYKLKYLVDMSGPNYAIQDYEMDEDQGTRNYSPSPSSPANIKSYELSFSDANENNQIEPDEVSYIIFKVRNDGSGIAKDVTVNLGEINGTYGLHYPKNTTVGDIGPGETREIRLSVSGESDLIDGVAEFEINVLEGNGFDANPVRISIPTKAYRPPILEIVDHHFATELGGRMRLGIPITLKIAVQNTGGGLAEGVSLVFDLPENVFTAGDNRFDLGNMKPNESRIIDFEFFTNKRYAQDDVPVTAQLAEERGRYRKRQTFIVKLNQQLEVADRVVITATPQETVDPQDIRLTSDVDRNLPRTFNKNPDGIAVVIGNRDYENADVPPVDFALQDAGSMRKYLIETYGFAEENILFFANATQADFNGIFGTKEDHKARLFNLVKENETDVFIFYSGHGAPDLESEDAYFVPVDCDPSLVKFNGYPLNTFYNNLAKIPYKSLTVVIDACFSGASDRGTLIPRASLVRIKASTSSIFKDPRAMVFTSAGGTEIASWYPEQSHGLFTYYFLKGLQGDANVNRDRNLTLGEMKSYLGEQVPYMARRLNNRVQTPEVYGAPDAAVLNY